MHPPDEPSPFLRRVRRAIRAARHGARTELRYVHWIRRYILFHGKRHPADLGAAEVADFLCDLAASRGAPPAAQGVALDALRFLYDHVLARPLGAPASPAAGHRARAPAAVLTPEEAGAVLVRLTGVPRLVAGLMYGSGLRCAEAVRLRIRDLDLEGGTVLVRDATGRTARGALLPERLAAPLRGHLGARRALFARDGSRGVGSVHLPPALAGADPQAGGRWAWQYVFPAARVGVDPRTGARRRHHLDEAEVHGALRRALRGAGIDAGADRDALRAAFAAHVLAALTRANGYGRREGEGTEDLSRAPARAGLVVRSPLDLLPAGGPAAVREAGGGYRARRETAPPPRSAERCAERPAAPSCARRAQRRAPPRQPCATSRKTS